MKKLDVMNMRDGKDTKPGEDLPWQIIDGKVQRVKEKVKEVKIDDGKQIPIDYPENKEEIKVEGPIVKKAIKEVKIVEKKEGKERKINYII